MNATSIHTLSHSAMLTPCASPARGNGAQPVARPHLTELRQQLLKPDPATTRALSAQYQAKADDPQAQESIGRELAARHAIDLLAGGAADNDEREFVVLQLLVGDADGFDKACVQAVARKLAALSTTMTRDGASPPPSGSIDLLGKVAEHYAANMRLVLGDARQATAAGKCFREEISQLARAAPSQIHKEVIESIVKAFDREAPPAVDSGPGDVAGREDLRQPQEQRTQEDHKHSQPAASTSEPDKPPVQAPLRGEVASPAARLFELARGKDAAAIRHEAVHLVAGAGQPALETLVDATLDRLCTLPSSAIKERRTLAALAWNLAGSPAGGEDRMAAMSLCSKFLDRAERVKDRGIRMALLADFGQAVRTQGRQAVNALERTVGARQLPADTRMALLAAATKQQGWLATRREPKFPQLRGLQEAIRQALVTHDAIEAAPTAASALGVLLAPGRLAALKHMPSAFQAHASHVLGLVKARAGATALQAAKACRQEAQAREAAVPRELAAPYREFMERLLDMQNALENANSPQGLAEQDARPAIAHLPPRERQSLAKPAAKAVAQAAERAAEKPAAQLRREPAARPPGPSADEWDAMFNGSLDDLELVPADRAQPPAPNEPQSNNPFDQPDEVLAQWARENQGPGPLIEKPSVDRTFEDLARQAAEELRRPAMKDDSTNPILDN